jgi:hypothetical protein
MRKEDFFQSTNAADFYYEGQVPRLHFRRKMAPLYGGVFLIKLELCERFQSCALHAGQGCQIFLVTTDQKRNKRYQINIKYTKWTQNIPNGYKIN